MYLPIMDLIDNYTPIEDVKIVKTNEESSWVVDALNRYPELSKWLANGKVQITNEGTVSSEKSHSENIFGEKFPELDRTLMTMQSLHVFLSGDEDLYKAFTAGQKEDNLSYKSFRSLFIRAENLIHNNPMNLSEEKIIKVLETALVLGDLGKSDIAREQFDVSREEVPDHDDCYRVVLNKLKDNPSLSKTFNNLDPEAQKFLADTAIDIHFGHISHLEGGPEIFSGLKNSKWTKYQLNFDFFVHLCDVSGALGHVNNKSSIVYTESTHKAKQAVYEACLLLIGKTSNTEIDAYNHYLSKRAEWLELDPKDPMDRVLTRIGSMLRLFTPEQSLNLKKAVEDLKEEDKEIITAQLNTEKVRENYRTPTYMPAVLVNLSNNKKLGETADDRLKVAITIGLPVIAKALEMYDKYVEEGKISQDVPLNFNPLAGTAKDFPDHFQDEDFDLEIDENGSVTLVNSSLDLLTKV